VNTTTLSETDQIMENTMRAINKHIIKILIITFLLVTAGSFYFKIFDNEITIIFKEGITETEALSTVRSTGGYNSECVYGSSVDNKGNSLYRMYVCYTNFGINTFKSNHIINTLKNNPSINHVSFNRDTIDEYHD
jgi:hypothetical protein